MAEEAKKSLLNLGNILGKSGYGPNTNVLSQLQKSARSNKNILRFRNTRKKGPVHRPRTPLIWAARHGDVEYARALLESGDNEFPNAEYFTNKGHISALEEGIFISESLPIVELLIPHTNQKIIWRALIRGIQDDLTYRFLKHLFNAIENINEDAKYWPKDYGYPITLYEMILNYRRRDLWNLLKQRPDFDIHHKNKDGETILFRTVSMRGYEDILEDLLQRGADPNEKGSWDRVPLIDTFGIDPLNINTNYNNMRYQKNSGANLPAVKLLCSYGAIITPDILKYISQYDKEKKRKILEVCTMAAHEVGRNAFAVSATNA